MMEPQRLYMQRLSNFSADAGMYQPRAGVLQPRRIVSEELCSRSEHTAGVWQVQRPRRRQGVILCARAWSQKFQPANRNFPAENPARVSSDDACTRQRTPEFTASLSSPVLTEGSAASSKGVAHLLKESDHAFRKVPGHLQLALRQLLVAKALSHPAQALRKVRRRKCVLNLLAHS